MEKLYNFKSILTGLSVLITTSIFTQTVFNFTGSPQTYTVPAGVNTLTIECLGAQGGAGGGLGAQIQGDVSVTSGDVLTIIVGEEGHLQLGGNFQNSAGGGGGSFVYNATTNTLLMAAGGGGGLCPWLNAVPLHADAAGQAGPDGGDNSDGQSLGGTGGNGGAEGIWSGTPCAGGGAGWLTVGGSIYGGLNAPTWAGGPGYCGGGGGGCGGVGGYGGGGGGGNLYGGGGGGGGYSGGAGGNDPDHGGGGGSFNSGTNQINNGGVNAGNGMVTITGGCSDDPLTVTVSDYTICGNETVTLNAVSTNGGTISWDNGVVNNVPFTPALTGENFYLATSTNPQDCPYEVVVTYSVYPDLDPGADVQVCEGTSALLNATSTMSNVTFSWTPFILNNVGFTAPLGETTYYVTADSYGCETLDSAVVTVNPEPEITLPSSISACTPDLVTLTASGNADTYSWTNGITNGVPFTPNLGSVTYTVTAEFTATSCTSDEDVTVHYYESPTISVSSTDEILGGDGTVSVSVNSGNGPFAIDWDNDGIGDNNDSTMIDSLAGGTYNVTVIDENGCSAVATVTVNSQLSVGQQNFDISIYPNPARDNVIIKTPGEFTYTLNAITGEKITGDRAVDKASIDMSLLSKGTYLVRITIDNEVLVRKLIKQ